MPSTSELLDRIEDYVLVHGQMPAAQYLMLRQRVANVEGERDALREALARLDSIAKDSAGVIAAVWLREQIAAILAHPA